MKTVIEKKKALVIEDSEELLEIWHFFLSKLNVDAKLAVSKKQALEIFSEGFVPEIVISDYYLEDGTGDEVIAEIKKCVSNLRVYFITGVGDVELRNQLKEKGAVLAKPVRFEEFQKIFLEDQSFSTGSN